MRRRRVNTHPVNPSDEEAETESSSSVLFASEKRVFAVCLALRIVNALLIQTYFNPDEHWQALEVAHRMVFGYGHLTWEWKKGIRSYLHPMLFALLYKILALLHLDTPLVMDWTGFYNCIKFPSINSAFSFPVCISHLFAIGMYHSLHFGYVASTYEFKLLIKAPRLLQSVFSAVGDLYIYKLSHVLFGDHVAKWALFCQLTNWFMFYCFNRTLSNSLETVLTLVGLYYWPCMRVSAGEVHPVSRKWGLAVAALACAIRPTSAITWLYVGLLELLVTRDRLRFIFLEVLPIGAVMLGLTCLLDRLMYGSWILVPLNFLKFNFLSSGGDYYGTHKWHWYLSSGFPVMIFTFMPFSFYGIMKSKHWKLCGLLVWVLALYSLLGHKEFRFVLPVLPIALMFSGYNLAKMERTVNKKKSSLHDHSKCPTKTQFTIFFLLATNIPMAMYMSLVHQRGAEDVMNYLSKEAQNEKVKSVLFLMPCHATPYYSTLHCNLPMRFLDCSPREDKELDESDQFLSDPVRFTSEIAKNRSLPSHVVLFSSEEKLLRDLFISYSYKELQRFFHAHFKVDRDLQAFVVVYTLTGSDS